MCTSSIKTLASLISIKFVFVDFILINCTFPAVKMESIFNGVIFSTLTPVISIFGHVLVDRK